MPEFDIDMSEVPAAYSRLDTGLLYLLRIQNVEIRKSGTQSRTPGEPYLAVTMEVRLPAEWEGRTVYDNLNLPIQPTPLDSVSTRRQKLDRGVRLRQYMEAFGLAWGPKGFKTEDWIGHEAGATVMDQEDQNGEMRTRVRKYIPAADAVAAINKMATKDMATPGGGAEEAGI
jgi:hypothetical protein